MRIGEFCFGFHYATVVSILEGLEYGERTLMLLTAPFLPFSFLHLSLESIFAWEGVRGLKHFVFLDSSFN